MADIISGLIRAVQTTDWLRYSRLLRDYRYHRSDRRPWCHHTSGTALTNLVTQNHAVDSPKAKDQIQILKSLLAEGTLVGFDQDRADSVTNHHPSKVFRLACLYGSLAVIKVLLATGCQVTLDLLVEVAQANQRDPYHPRSSGHQHYDQVLLLLLQHCQLDLGWLFIHRDHALAFGWAHSVSDLANDIYWLDKVVLNRAVMLMGMDFQHVMELDWAVWETLNSAMAYNTVQMLNWLGLLDSAAIQAYSRNRSEPFEYLTTDLLQRVATD